MPNAIANPRRAAFIGPLTPWQLPGAPMLLAAAAIALRTTRAMGAVKPLF